LMASPLDFASSVNFANLNCFLSAT